MTRFGEPIARVGIRGGVNPHISYNLSFLEWDTCVSLGLDLWRWADGKYPRWFKAKAIAFHNMRQAISSHKEDAMSREIDKKSRKAKQGKK